VAKVAQSATATWPKPCQVSHEVGPGTFFKQKNILQGYNSNFFFHRDENQNGPKLQGRLSYLSQLSFLIFIPQKILNF